MERHDKCTEVSQYRCRLLESGKCKGLYG